MDRRPSRTQDDLSTAQRRAVVAGIVALHGALAWGLLQIAPVREAIRDAAPLFVDLIAPPAPPRPPEPLPPPPPKLAVTPPPPVRQIVAAAPSPAPAPFVVPEAPPEPAPVVIEAPPEPAPVVVVAPPPAPAPPAPPPPPPKEIPASAVAYLEPPAPVYPRASKRAGEFGVVAVRVFIDPQGQPRQIQVQRSSGYQRLDEAAVDAVRHARFRPYVENGQASAGWASIAITFELEK